MEDAIKNTILGFIIGDAIGVPVEFISRDKLQKSKVADMIGNLSHNVPAGSWSDDSSMILATMDSIVSCNELNLEDIMNRFTDWVNEGKYTPNGKCFGIGRTTLQSIRKYNTCKEPLKSGQGSYRDNGNGSLMRMLPIACYCYAMGFNDNQIYRVINDTSSITHAHEISVMGCYIYSMFIIKSLKLFECSKDDIYSEIQNLDYSMFSEDTRELYSRIISEDISSLSIKDIKSSGFIVDTLEACIWCYLKNKSYENAIIEAINLGDDTDTISALTGGLFTGHSSIPKRWIHKLLKLEYINKNCDIFVKYLTNN